MVANNHGHIVTIASLAGSIGTPGMVEYCASKFAAVGLHESLYFELDKLGIEGVKMTLVQPWWIDTGMFDGFAPRKGISPPALHPQYVADKVLHAVQINQEVIALPRDGYIIQFLKTIMPTSATGIVGRFGGTYTAMDTFIGRDKKHT
ncbi:retinol dehydrogenase 10-B-like [Ptychodera flava]